MELKWTLLRTFTPKKMLIKFVLILIQTARSNNSDLYCIFWLLHSVLMDEQMWLFTWKCKQE